MPHLFPPCILFFDNYDCYDYVNSDFLSSLITELDKCEAGDRTALIVATSKLQNIPRDVGNFARFETVVQLVDNLNFIKRIMPRSNTNYWAITNHFKYSIPNIMAKIIAAVLPAHKNTKKPFSHRFYKCE